MKKAAKKPVKEAPKEAFNFFDGSCKAECLAVKIAQLRCLVGVVAGQLSEDTVHDDEANCLWLVYDLLNSLDKKITQFSEELMDQHRKTL